MEEALSSDDTSNVLIGKSNLCQERSEYITNLSDLLLRKVILLGYPDKVCTSLIRHAETEIT